MIEPNMATMLGFPDHGRRCRAGPAAPRAYGRGRRHIQRHHGRWRDIDQRHGLAACWRPFPGPHRRHRLPGVRRCAPHGVSGAGARRGQGGEGATKLVAVTVTGARTTTEAKQTARAIANSPLVKTAVHGGDPNWGRLVAVAGRRRRRFRSRARARQHRRGRAVRRRAGLRRPRAGGDRASKRIRGGARGRRRHRGHRHRDGLDL